MNYLVSIRKEDRTLQALVIYTQTEALRGFCDHVSMRSWGESNLFVQQLFNDGETGEAQPLIDWYTIALKTDRILERRTDLIKLREHYKDHNDPNHEEGDYL
jgi:hypothetical protein